MYEDVDLITEDLIKESGSNSISLIILNCQFCKKNCEHQIMVSWEIIKIWYMKYEVEFCISTIHTNETCTLQLFSTQFKENSNENISKHKCTLYIQTCTSNKFGVMHFNFVLIIRKPWIFELDIVISFKGPRTKCPQYMYMNGIHYINKIGTIMCVHSRYFETTVQKLAPHFTST